MTTPGPTPPDPTPPDAPDPTPTAAPVADDAHAARRRALLGALVVVTAAIGVWLTSAADRLDAAVLFVGLPALLAFGIAMRPRARTLHGAIASGTTFALLLAAILLQEGAICVVLSAPLVFAITHGVAASTRRIARRYQVGVLLPLLLVASAEGVLPGWRVVPVQTVTVAAVVDAAPAQVAARLAAGPDLAAAERPLLLRTGFPVPSEAHGDGLDVGDRWTFDYRGHPIVTEVTATEVDDDTGRVAFTAVHDGSKTARWLTWQDAELRWTPTADGATAVTVAIRFERGLDPSWWFGPVEDALVRAGASYLLDGLTTDLDAPTATTTGTRS